MKIFYIISIFIILVGCNNNSNDTTNNNIIDTLNTITKNTSKILQNNEISNEQNLTKTDTITKDSTIITVETSVSPCIITKIFTKNNKNYIVADYTRITDQEEEESGMPIYENKNPKLRTFLINNSTEITTFNWEKNTDNGVYKISLNEFINNKNAQISDFTKWNIKVENGVVKKLNEIYYP